MFRVVRVPGVVFGVFFRLLFGVLQPYTVQAVVGNLGQLRIFKESL